MQLYRTYQYYSKRFSGYHISTYAASASFFIITAIFPLMMVLMSVISFTSLSVEDFLEMISSILPESFAPYIASLLEDMFSSSAATLSLSLLITLWTAAKSMLGLLDGLNAIADVNDTRNFFFKRIVCIGYTMVLILGLLLNLGLRVFGQHILSLLQQISPGLARLFSSALQQQGLTLFLLLTMVFLLIYTFFPNKKMKFYMQIPGAVFTSLAWLAFSSLFSVYVNNSGQFSSLYGSLTTLILVMLWLYICMYIIFLGAIINKNYPEVFWKLYVWVKRRRPGRRSRRAGGNVDAAGPDADDAKPTLNSEN